MIFPNIQFNVGMYLSVLPTLCFIFGKSLPLAGGVKFIDRRRFYDMTTFLYTVDLNQIEKP